MTWPYADPQFREDLHSGTVQVDRSHLITSYRQWVKDEQWLKFENQETGDTFSVMSPKRGNIAYANKQRRKWRKLMDAMDGKTWDVADDMPGARPMDRRTHLLFITLTFDQERHGEQEAWQLCTSRGKALNRFSAHMYKALGSKATVKVKEATKSGYPAPHILVVLDSPIQCFRYRNKWRIRSQGTLQKLRQAWPHGFVDVRAIVGGEDGAKRAMSYISAYLTKSTKVPMDEVKPTVAELTHAWNKAFGCRDVISKHFKEKLGVTAQPIVADDEPSEWQFVGFDTAGDQRAVAAKLFYAMRGRLTGTRPPDLKIAG